MFTIGKTFLLTALMIVITVVGSSLPVGALNKSSIKGKLMKQADLPPEWVKAPPSGSGSEGGICPPPKKPKSDTRATVSFVSSHLFPTLNESLEEGPSALSSYKTDLRAYSTCTTFSIKSGGLTITGTGGSMTFPKVGDSSQAFSYEAHLSYGTVGIDLVAFHQGSYFGAILLSTLGVPSTIKLEQLANEAIAQIRGDALPLK